MPIVNGKKIPYTVEGLKRAEVLANKTNPPSPIQADQSLYGTTNANPNMNPDNNTLLSQRRQTKPYRKNPRPYKTNQNLT